MKAREYFEKYFKDLEITLPNIVESSKQMLNDFNDELKHLMKQRNCKTDSAAIAVVKELNQKWNSVIEKVHKHYGFVCLKRNVFWNYFAAKFPELKRKPD